MSCPDTQRCMSHLPNGTDDITTSKPSNQADKASCTQRIGRRRVNADETVSWISQHDWDLEQHQVEISRAEQARFALCFDDANDKSIVRIFSPILIDVIKTVIPFSFFESAPRSVSFQEPYAHLYRYSVDITREMRSRADLEPTAFVDLQALELFLQEKAGYWVWDSLKGRNEDVVSFENLWALFRPGDYLVVQDRLEEKVLFKFTRMDEVSDTVGFKKDFCVAMAVNFWFVSWSPGEKRFRQKYQLVKIERYVGQKKASTLPIYPLRYEDEATQKVLLDRLHERGKKWANLVSNSPTCFNHSGQGLPLSRGVVPEDVDITQVQGRMVLDLRDVMQLRNTVAEVEFGPSSSEVDEKLNDSWSESRLSKLYDPTQYRLCPPHISCYHLETGKHYLVSVTNLDPVCWERSALDQLILDEEKKSFLKTLVSNAANFKLKAGDIIANKGRGLTIILHGPPGVGKTLTAECLAEYAKKPMIPLSVGNLVGIEDSMEDELTEAFAKASRLDAILLLDEADVILEARSFEDVRRNGMVSVFLRHLEYYSGILFLTTNRISAMDPAFQSRIQVAIQYFELSHRQRSDIWQSLLNSKVIDCTEHDKDTIIDRLDEFADYPLNGRQIRNVLNLSAITAAADITSDYKVQVRHVEKALAEAVKFQRFFDDGNKDTKNRNRVWKPFAPPQQRTRI